MRLPHLSYQRHAAEGCPRGCDLSTCQLASMPASCSVGQTKWPLTLARTVGAALRIVTQQSDEFTITSSGLDTTCHSGLMHACRGSKATVAWIAGRTSRWPQAVLSGAFSHACTSLVVVSDLGVPALVVNCCIRCSVLPYCSSQRALDTHCRDAQLLRRQAQVPRGHVESYA